MYAFLSGYTLNRTIGSKYEYSNFGFALLGHILTRVADSDYETLVRRRICKPLKMKHTAISISAKQRKKTATGYDRHGKHVTSYLKFEVFESAAAMRSTVNDLLKFAAANLGITSSKLDSAIKLSHIIQDSTGMANLDIALGWHSLNRYGKRILWHNGQTGGFKSFIGLDKENKTGIVILANGGNPVDDIGLHALNKNYKLQSFKYTWLIRDTVYATVTREGADAAINLYYSLKKLQKPDFIFNELQLNNVAAELMSNKKIKEAIVISKLNTEEYPKSWRAFNNLADIYIMEGNEKLAIEAYEKSVDLNSINNSAVEKLKKLKSK
jgi:CubicO group peptidase (beta-lactamase class C family)